MSRSTAINLGQGAAALAAWALWADHAWSGLVVWALTFGVDVARRAWSRAHPAT